MNFVHRMQLELTDDDKFVRCGMILHNSLRLIRLREVANNRPLTKVILTIGRSKHFNSGGFGQFFINHSSNCKDVVLKNIEAKEASWLSHGRKGPPSGLPFICWRLFHWEALDGWKESVIPAPGDNHHTVWKVHYSWASLSRFTHVGEIEPPLKIVLN